jgi:autotransporter-associated beta strand protein
MRQPIAFMASIPSPSPVSPIMLAFACMCQGTCAQVISVQPSAALSAGNYLGSARAQFGATQPQNYLTAVLGGAQITTDQQAAIVAQGGFTASSNPPFWTQGANNTFRLAYSSVTQSLTLTIFRPGGAVQSSIHDVANFAGANGLNLNFAGLNASFFGGLTVTSAGQTVAIGPGGDWSSTSLANSTLTGWDLTQTWRIDGFLRFLQPGQDALPRLQFDILNQRLAYQLSDQGAGRPAVINYGRIRDMVVVDSDFNQARFGGTDGVVTANIQSRGAVTFNIVSAAEFAGGIVDLTSLLVPVAEHGIAELVKTGAGTLILSGSSNYGGKLRLQDGNTVLRNASGIGAAGLDIGSATLTIDVDPALGAGDTVTILGGATMAAGAAADVRIGATLRSARGNPLTLRNLRTVFDGDASDLAGGIVVDGGELASDGHPIGGNAQVTHEARLRANGSVTGDVSVTGAALEMNSTAGTFPATLTVGGRLQVDGSSEASFHLFLEDCGDGIRCSDRLIASAPSSLQGRLLFQLDSRNGSMAMTPPEGTVERWRVIGAPSISYAISAATLQLTRADGAIQDITLSLDGATIVDDARFMLEVLPGTIDLTISRTPTGRDCLGDINVDHRVDGGDLGALLANWGPATSAAASRACDLDADGQVNGSDLGVLLFSWGPCQN